MKNNRHSLSNIVFVCLYLQIQTSAFAEQNAKTQWPQQQGIFTLYLETSLQLFDTEAELKTLTSGFDWIEGPVWIDEGSYFLFSDIPKNRVYSLTG